MKASVVRVLQDVEEELALVVAGVAAAAALEGVAGRVVVGHVHGVHHHVLEAHVAVRALVLAQRRLARAARTVLVVCVVRVVRVSRAVSRGWRAARRGRGVGEGGGRLCGRRRRGGGG